ncbi:hypothetical protein [Acidovorax sp. LjRoot194]|uniref:hypothetical protein n=1 Tax=Acidovorax sp. LjRoot194 TaxID=3342280 RepID=UPI003ECEA783
MDRKLLMGVAAVAGIGLLLYLRKSGDQATLAGSSSLVGALGGGSAWASQPIVVNAPNKPAVADASAISAAPPPPKPAAAPIAATTPWTMQPIVDGTVSWGGSGWLQSNGKPVADGYAFAHLTPEQRGGRTDAQIVGAFL